MVNIFVSSSCPKKSARAIDSKRLARMCYEAYELLSSAMLKHTEVAALKPLRGKVYHAHKGHYNHPVVSWVMADRLHFQWTLEHAEALNEEYFVRYKNGDCQPHIKMNKVLRKALPHIPNGMYDHDDITNIEFRGFFNFNEFKEEYSPKHPGKVRLPQKVDVVTRYKLYMLHKWLYLDSRDVTWPDSPPAWAFNPLYRDFLRRYFGKPTNKPAMLNPNGSAAVKALAKVDKKILDLSEIGKHLTRRFKFWYERLENNDGDRISSACYNNEKQTHRLYLSRQWSTALPLIVIMLNPSTASVFDNDPTVARIETLAHRLNCGGYIVMNVAAYMATEPKDMIAANDPFHPLNEKVIKAAVSQVVQRWRQKPQILLAYGNNVEKIDGGVEVANRIGQTCSQYGKLVSLKMTKRGHPQHPLYLSNKILPERYLPW